MYRATIYTVTICFVTSLLQATVYAEEATNEPSTSNVAENEASPQSDDNSHSAATAPSATEAKESAQTDDNSQPAATAPSATEANSSAADSYDFSQKRSRSIAIGNILFGIGTAGGFAGDLLVYFGQIKNNDGFYWGGSAASAGFSTISFAGTLVSGIAATKLNRRAGSGFNWGYWGGGLGVAALGNTLSGVALSKDNSDAYLSIAIATRVIQAMLWVPHCLAARDASKSSKSSASIKKGASVAMTPVVNPTNKQYGLAFSVYY